MSNKVRCPNLNHGKTNVNIKFCPMCGKSLNPQAQGRCDEIFHASQRKTRNAFCYMCGKKLTG